MSCPVQSCPLSSQSSFVPLWNYASTNDNYIICSFFSSKCFTFGKSCRCAPFKRTQSHDVDVLFYRYVHHLFGSTKETRIITSIPASLNALQMMRAPRSCPSKPSFDTRTFIGLLTRSLFADKFQ